MRKVKLLPGKPMVEKTWAEAWGKALTKLVNMAVENVIDPKKEKKKRP